MGLFIVASQVGCASNGSTQSGGSQPGFLGSIKQTLQKVENKLSNTSSASTNAVTEQADTENESTQLTHPLDILGVQLDTSKDTATKTLLEKNPQFKQEVIGPKPVKIEYLGLANLQTYFIDQEKNNKGPIGGVKFYYDYPPSNVVTRIDYRICYDCQNLRDEYNNLIIDSAAPSIVKLRSSLAQKFNTSTPTKKMYNPTFSVGETYEHDFYVWNRKGLLMSSANLQHQLNRTSGMCTYSTVGSTGIILSSGSVAEFNLQVPDNFADNCATVAEVVIHETHGVVKDYEIHIEDVAEFLKSYANAADMVHKGTLDAQKKRLQQADQNSPPGF